MPHLHTSWTEGRWAEPQGPHRCPLRPPCLHRGPPLVSHGSTSASVAVCIHGLASVKWEERQVPSDHFLKYSFPITRNDHVVIAENLKNTYFLSVEKGKKNLYNVLMTTISPGVFPSFRASLQHTWSHILNSVLYAVFFTSCFPPAVFVESFLNLPVTPIDTWHGFTGCWHYATSTPPSPHTHASHASFFEPLESKLQMSWGFTLRDLSV